MFTYHVQWSGSSHAAKEDEFVIDIPMSNELGEQLDGCQFLEIARTAKMKVEKAKLKADLASVIA